MHLDLWILLNIECIAIFYFSMLVYLSDKFAFAFTDVIILIFITNMFWNALLWYGIPLSIEEIMPKNVLDIIYIKYRYLVKNICF